MLSRLDLETMYMRKFPHLTPRGVLIYCVGTLARLSTDTPRRSLSLLPHRSGEWAKVVHELLCNTMGPFVMQTQCHSGAGSKYLQFQLQLFSYSDATIFMKLKWKWNWKRASQVAEDEAKQQRDFTRKSGIVCARIAAWGWLVWHKRTFVRSKRNIYNMSNISCYSEAMRHCS